VMPERTSRPSNRFTTFRHEMTTSSGMGGV
jgi:hypothetical protein